MAGKTSQIRHFVPEVTLVAAVPHTIGVPLRGDYLFAATMLDTPLKAVNLREPPHVGLANLPTLDETARACFEPLSGLRLPPFAVRAFVQKYGMLRDHGPNEVLHPGLSPSDVECFAQKYGLLRDCGPNKVPRCPVTAFGYHLQIAEYCSFQAKLRKAWTDDEGALRDFFHRMVSLEIDRLLFQDECYATNDPAPIGVSLMDYIYVLFVRDHDAGRLGVCPNPECPAPYFVKKGKRGQKICGYESCKAWLQRSFSRKSYRKRHDEKWAQHGRRTP